MELGDRMGDSVIVIPFLLFVNPQWLHGILVKYMVTIAIQDIWVHVVTKDIIMEKGVLAVVLSTLTQKVKR